MYKIVQNPLISRIALYNHQYSFLSTLSTREPTFHENTSKVLGQISKSLNYTHPNVSCYGQVGKGQGATGDLYYVNIHDTKSDQILELLVKQATTAQKVRDYFPVHSLYHNESIFFKKIWPVYVKYQQNDLGNMIFDNVPQCYGADVKPGEECLVFENLKPKNFANIDKKKYVDKELFKLILKKYGQLHGLSYTFKMKDRQVFAELSHQLVPYWERVTHIIPLKVSITDMFQKCLIYLANSNDDRLISKMKNYSNNGLHIFTNSSNYVGDHGVFVHGDSWSNNIMFKFDKHGQVDNLKLVDFQMCKVGSVVYDLSYCLYSGGSQQIFDNLDYYIGFYHHYLASTCSEFGCNNYISLDELKKEWKEYSKFGWMMAMVMLKAKLIRDDSNLDLLRMLVEFEKRDSKAHFDDSDAEEVEKRSLVLIDHMNKNGFL